MPIATGRSTRQLKRVYETGYRLLKKKYASNQPALHQHLYVPTVQQRVGKRSVRLSDLYFELLMSLRNRQYMSGPISPENVKLLGRTLCRYGPKGVIRKYANLPDEMQSDMLKSMQRGKGASGRARKLFCQGAYDGAMFLSLFGNAKRFFKFAEQFDGGWEDRWMLPAAIESRIRGMGPVLACNFLKESGLTQYSKPDTQVIKLLKDIGLPAHQPREAFCTMAMMAEAASVTDYMVDKVLWLIATGRWTEDMNDDGKLDTREKDNLRKQFVRLVGKLRQRQGKHD